jgi:hypothetical protein
MSDDTLATAITTASLPETEEARQVADSKGISKRVSTSTVGAYEVEVKVNHQGIRNESITRWDGKNFTAKEVRRLHAAGYVVSSKKYANRTG